MYDGYTMCCFSAATENGVAPLVGYLPGKVPWTLETRLRELGANVTGSEKGTVLVDRELITGDSPNAENEIAAVALPLLFGLRREGEEQGVTRSARVARSSSVDYGGMVSYESRC